VVQLAELFKKYGVAGVLAAVIAMGFPYVEQYISMETNQSTQIFVHKMKAEILQDIQRMLDKQTAIAVDAHAKTKLSDKQAIYLMKTAVGYQSIYKVEWLKDYLKNNKDYILHNKTMIRNAIRAELVRQSSIYVEALNGFVHPKIGRLGDFVNDNFDMVTFLEGIYLIVFASDCAECETTYTAIMYHMLDAQNDLWYKAEQRMSR
jgi:hypothetical protein